MLQEKTIEREVIKYLENLPVKVSRAILFGSSVRGDRLVDSDIDLIVISEDFKHMNFPKRFLILQKNCPLKLTLDVFGFTEDEFNKLKRKSIVLQEAVKYGKVLCYEKRG